MILFTFITLIVLLLLILFIPSNFLKKTPEKMPLPRAEKRKLQRKLQRKLKEQYYSYKATKNENCRYAKTKGFTNKDEYKPFYL